jgi:hypothetical protein
VTTAVIWLLAGAVMPIAAAQAQRRLLPVDDSLGASVGLVTRPVWRAVSLGDETAIISGISFPLRFLTRGLQAELTGTTNLTRDALRTTDQYSGSVRYQIPLRSAPHRRSLVIGTTNQWAPDAAPSLSEHTIEATGALLWNVGIEKLGIRTLGLTLDAARDLRRENATWLSAGATISGGTTFPRVSIEHAIIAILRVALSASDYNGPLLAEIPHPRFGTHSADAVLEVEYGRRRPAGSMAIRTALQVGATARNRRLGPDVGWLGLRWSALFF